MSYKFGELSWHDLEKMVIGDLIGEGCFRKVYEYIPDRSCVIKVEDGARNFSNVKEWEMWNEIRRMKISKWFAPCVSISPSGIFLVQKRTSPIIKAYPKKIPSMFRDIKLGNVGMYEDHFCFHDYANSTLLTNSYKEKFMTAHWDR